LTLLSQSDKQEIEDKLRQRVEFSERAIGKLLQAHDRLLQRREKLWDAIRTKRSHGECDSATVPALHLLEHTFCVESHT